MWQTTHQTSPQDGYLLIRLQQVGVSSPTTYPISVFDPEGNVVALLSTSVLPSFVSISGLSFVINPDYSIGPSLIFISFDASDAVSLISGSFYLNVLNSPPIYTASSATLVYNILSLSTYKPNIVDPDGNSITITSVIGNPSFMIL